MNYYIQGDAANADQIKAAFEAKGFIPRIAPMYYGSESVLFFTGTDNYIYETPSPWVMDIIKTHPDYKELGLPVEPKFKVGDEIIWNGPKGSKPTEPVKIIQLIDKDQLYMVDMQNGVGYVAYDMQDYYKLVQKPHYDIANFHAGMPVLVRDDRQKKWCYALYSHNDNEDSYQFVTAGDAPFIQCIPFEGNEHLLGTTDMCEEMYINW